MSQTFSNADREVGRLLGRPDDGLVSTTIAPLLNNTISMQPRNSVLKEHRRTQSRIGTAFDDYAGDGIDDLHAADARIFGSPSRLSGPGNIRGVRRKGDASGCAFDRGVRFGGDLHELPGAFGVRRFLAGQSPELNERSATRHAAARRPLFSRVPELSLFFLVKPPNPGSSPVRRVARLSTTMLRRGQRIGLMSGDDFKHPSKHGASVRACFTRFLSRLTVTGLVQTG